MTTITGRADPRPNLGWWSKYEPTPERMRIIINADYADIELRVAKYLEDYDMGTHYYVTNRRAYAVARGPLGRFAPVSDLGETAVPAHLPPVFTNDDGTFRRPEGLRERAVSLLSKRR